MSKPVQAAMFKRRGGTDDPLGQGWDSGGCDTGGMFRDASESEVSESC